ncbi:hypothetical protein AX14_013128 [Amanita brunnescens Koide BX004]|nr:hypothetical protein AX14_013128 [Amanita brunnescens Koide BX004]
MSANELSQPLISNLSDAVTNISDTASNQQDLVTSFSGLMNKLTPLVKIGVQVGKIHPYVNFAWQVLSAGMKIVQAQQARNVKILDLVRAMEKTYSFVVSTDELKSQPVLQDIIEEIMKETIECGYFIQGYARRSFGESAIVNPFTDVDDQIAAFCTAFANLRKDFDSRLLLTTALFLPRLSSAVDTMARHQVLKPEIMDEYNRTPCLKNMRRNVINDIMAWIADNSNEGKKVMWVYGLAGTGKSTLSTTIAQIMTLAYQLAAFDARFRDAISRVVADNENIAGMPLEFQFESLLSANALKSVEWPGGPIVLVVDALNECGSEADLKKLMRVLSKGFSDLPSLLRIMVVSRPELDIEHGLGSHLHLRPYPLEIDSTTNKDVTEFIRHRLEEIRTEDKYLGNHWPGDDKINSLANRAGGLSYGHQLHGCQRDRANPYPPSFIPRLYIGTVQGPALSIDIEHRNKELALRCIELLDEELHENMCGMTLPYLRRKHALPEAISYACRFWIKHICLVSDVTDDIVNRTYDFLVKHLLHWMEALAILNSYDHLIRSIDNLMKWLRTSSQSHTDLQQLVYDGHRFAHLTIHSNKYEYLQDILSQRPAESCLWSPELIQLQGHDHRVNSVAFSLDGSKIVSGSSDKTIRVWDASTGLPPIHGGDWISSVAFSPDGSKIISGSGDRTIRVWDASTGNEMFPPLRGHDDWIRAVAFSPDGSKIISGSEDNTIRVWDASTGIEMLPPLRGHDYGILSIAFWPDGSKIISGSRDTTIRVWDASTGVEILPPLRCHNNGIDSVEFSPDGSKIISEFYDGMIRVWDASTGNLLPRPQLVADDAPRPAMDEPMIRGRLTSINTGRYMGALPDDVHFHCGHLRGSTYIGWTATFELVIAHFPEQ